MKVCKIGQVTKAHGIQSSGGNTGEILREYSLMIFDGILAYPNQTELLLEPLARLIHECRHEAAETKVM
jgi:hypothetical protein